MAALSRLAPDRVVPVDGCGDGFLLTPDQGPVFYETAGDDLESWVRLAREAALLQRELVPHHEALLATGMTELAPAEAHDYLAARIEQYAALVRGRPAPPRARGRRPPARATCPSYAGGPSRSPPSASRSPSTTTTCTTNNVFDVDGRLRFFDFGDSLLTEPLGRAADPAQRPRRDARGRRRRPAAVARGGRRARGLERPGARSPSCAPRCRRRSSSVGWGGSSRGCAASRRCSTSELAEWGPVAARLARDARRGPARRSR